MSFNSVVRLTNVFIFITSFSFICSAQMSEKSDPAATKILDKLKAEYDSYKTLFVDFELILDLPEQPQELQKGFLKQKGDKFAAKMGDQEIYCDGKSISLYLPSNNEVQINDYDPKSAGEFITPKDLLRLYEDGQYYYAITGEEIVNKTKCVMIEFKPLDRRSEYSKMRLAVDTKNNKAKSIKVFAKDGSRYTLNIESIKGNVNLDDKEFTFNKAAHPGVRVEDLRID